MNRSRRVKILATLGPASNTAAKIEELALAGADVFRINMSHASHDLMRETVANIRGVEAKLGYPIGILADLQGPKHRLGAFEGGEADVAPGDEVTLDSDPTPGTKRRVQLPHPEILEAMKVGHRLLVNDGKVAMTVVETGEGWARARVDSGTWLADNKGVNLPDSELASGALTDKDRKDLDAVLKEEIDWIALSFIQRPEDLAEARKICGNKVGILAKIEKPQAVERLDEIIDMADAIMVARGDLGVEMPLEMVPSIQKKMVRKCRRAGTPVVVATQMLESMIKAPVPTRAEVSDVANAVYEGADAVMLSAESAAGDYPVEAVKMMNSICEAIERDKGYLDTIAAQTPEPDATAADAIAFAADQIADTLDLKAIVCFTASGSTALRVARTRPAKPILALSPITETARRLTLLWGTKCVTTPDAKDLKDVVDKACRKVSGEQMAGPGERIIIVVGVPLRTAGSTNMLRIAYVNAEGKGAQHR
ncbi:pyruvate kinase [Rhizobiaceae bacterium]|nr:pyruvate kinase [Rhizobiaceae bacterium]